MLAPRMLEEVGGLAKLLSDHADAVMASVAKEETSELAIAWIECAVASDDARANVSRSNVKADRGPRA